ncbi:hypothetical protein LQZ18_18065 [Lachnospiraceae bacterium ZAX-1]
MKKDEFASINKTKRKGNGFLILIGIMAICITGVLCAKKMQQDSRYITLAPDNVEATMEEA